jgi:hypothetical protein
MERIHEEVGWNDESFGNGGTPESRGGMTGRSDIPTSFEFIDGDEGRLPKPG